MKSYEILKMCRIGPHLHMRASERTGSYPQEPAGSPRQTGLIPKKFVAWLLENGMDKNRDGKSTCFSTS